MPHDRFFIDTSLQTFQKVILLDDEAHHLHVMRKNIGDTVELINGQNVLAKANIQHVEKKRYVLEITDAQTFPNPPTLILAQAIPRLNRLDDIIEKGTELGVTEFRLFPGEKSEKKNLGEKDFERLRKITISAMKQCGRLDLPSITSTPPISKLTQLPVISYFGDISPTAPLFKDKWSDHETILFFVGPEAGFSPSEIAQLKSLKAIGVMLHPYILRTDTAPLVALSLIQHWKMGK